MGMGLFSVKTLEKGRFLLLSIWDAQAPGLLTETQDTMAGIYSLAHVISACDPVFIGKVFWVLFLFHSLPCPYQV